MTARQTTEQPASSGNIFTRIPAIMREIPAVPKDRNNDQQHYKFRGIDEVYNLIHPIMAKHGVFMTSKINGDKTTERPSKSGGVLITRAAVIMYTFWAEDGSSVSTEVLAEGMDSGDKAANKAMSVGQKYAILQMFLVPTDEPKDPEIDTPEPAAASSSPDDDDFMDMVAPPSQFDHLDEFAKAKKAMGNVAYYKVLGQLGVEHANEIALDKRPAVLKTMREIYKTNKGTEKK